MRRATRRAPDIGWLSFHSPGEHTVNNVPDPKLNPGDEARPGTPGAAEDICDGCSGSGKVADGSECPECGGSGRVMRGIGGG